MSEVRRAANAPHRKTRKWKGSAETDRGKRARVEAAIARGEYEPPKEKA